MKRFLLLIVIAICLVGCQKSAFDYIRESKAHLAAANVRDAESTLKEGLRRYPDSPDLKDAYANLLLKTGRTDELSQYLRMNSFERMESYWAAVASTEFKRGNWEPAYDAYVRAGDAVRMYRPQECSPLSAENYRNSIAARQNAGRISENLYVHEQMERVLTNCRRCKTCRIEDKSYVEKMAADIGVR